MALSPEDVVKKKFETTQLKKGYKEHEVDDFLDEVVVELRRLGVENASLNTDLADCRASKGLAAEAARPGSDTEVAAAPEVHREELTRLHRERDELVAEIDELTARATQQREGAAVAGEQSATRAASAPAAIEDPGAIISLAQRVHDEHVAEGESTKARLISEAESYRDTTVREADERNAGLIESAQLQHDELVTTGQRRHDELLEQGQTTHDRLVGEGQATHHRLVGEGQTTHDRLVSEGQERHGRFIAEGEQTRDQMIGEAEQRRANVLADLGAQRAGITATIEELKGFESDYRGRLRELLSEQMSLLDRDAQLS